MKPLLTALMAACLAAFALAACGGGDGPPDTANPNDFDIDAGTRGGEVVFLARGDIDYADPGATYYTFGFMVQSAVNRSLYAYRPDSDLPVADLAAGAPQVSADNRTITVRLKPDVRYAPPVGGVVTADDVKYAIERAFTTNVRSSYATSYFGHIEGAPDKPVPFSQLQPFAGIETPNDYTLVLKLDAPVAQRVVAALVMPITVPVPEAYARRFDRSEPSAYEDHVAFTGPYMIRNDRKTGELTGYEDGKRIALVRNPNWDADNDFRPAYLNKITIEEGAGDSSRILKQTLSGEKLLCCDTLEDVPPAQIRRALDRFGTQVGSVPAGGTRWIALNTTVAPFDNANVRKAVIAAFDRDALRETLGGEVMGPVAQGYLPPGVPGFEQSGGEAGVDTADWMAAPGGDAELARKYMLAARADGVPVDEDGTYAGKEPVLMIATNASPGLATAQSAQQQLTRLGFKVDLRRVPADVLFDRYCGNRRADVAVCPNVAWFKDFNDPEEMLRPTFSGDALVPTDNTNWSELADPAIDQQMRDASLLAGTDRAEAWADVNRAIVAQAPGIPYLWDNAYQAASSDLNAVMSPFSTTWDLNYVSLR